VHAVDLRLVEVTTDSVLKEREREKKGEKGLTRGEQRKKRRVLVEARRSERQLRRKSESEELK
jgi:hypothetical protein